MVVSACDPSTLDVRAGGSWVQGQPQYKVRSCLKMIIEPGLVVHTFNSSPGKEEAGRFLRFRSQPDLHTEFQDSQGYAVSYPPTPPEYHPFNLGVSHDSVLYPCFTGYLLEGVEHIFCPSNPQFLLVEISICSMRLSKHVPET